MNITIKQLRAFISVAKHQHFTLAAKELHLSQSALSGLIKELENTLEFQLFERNTRQLKLSDMGEKLLPKAKCILEHLNAFESEVVGIKHSKQDEVKIAISQQFASSVMPKLIAKFGQMHPNIRLTLIDCSVETVLQQVANREVDFGIGAQRYFEDNILASLLFELPFFVVMPSHHPFASENEVSWAMLRHEKIITLQGSFSKNLLDDLPPMIANLLKQPYCEVNFFPTALGLTAQDIGLTLCLPYVSERVKQQNLIMKPLTNPVIYRKFLLYQRKNCTLSPAMKTFVQFLTTHIDDIL